MGTPFPKMRFNVNPVAQSLTLYQRALAIRESAGPGATRLNNLAELWECTVNQLINWRMCKKKQMGWTRAAAQYLLHVKTAIINGRRDRYTGHHSAPADMAA
jgi:hypothetical protein